ncbi:putative S-crystallin SL11-like [Apostichopus japonicus]|uniref:Putative S-crystallin SL11-like n=1 Tax=Stichopus japonicus TaxID=307972 RepID=A0A2G8K1E6_STIJA|nr:putative S-crystallin SL11-like [Apostichopus japonicus]
MAFGANYRMPYGKPPYAIYGFLGSSIWERAQINVVCETVKDFAPEISQFFAEKDETRKAELKKAYLTVGVYKHIGNLEKLLKQNNDGTGWFVGDKVSLADVEAFARVYDFISFLDGKEPGDFDLKDHAVFKGFIERFKSQPKIADWISKRPQTSL